MAMTYSLEFRQKVFVTKEKFQLTFQETSERFDIPIRTIFRWQRQLEPCIRRNKPATKVNMEKLMQHVKDYPDAYLRERAQVLGVTFQTVHCALKRLNVSYKKNTTTP